MGRLVECPACRSSLLVPARSTVWPPALRKFLWVVTANGLAVMALTGLAVHLLVRDKSGDVTIRSARVPTLVAPSEPRVQAQAQPGPVEREKEADPGYAALKSEHRALGSKYEELANWVLSNMRGHFLLSEKLSKHVLIPPMTDDYLVNPDFAEYLKLSAKEQELLEDAFGFGLSSLVELESRFLSVTQSAPDRAVVQIPSYEQEGAAMREDLYRAMETVLGAQRFGQLLQAGEKELAQRYHYFGHASRSMVFQETASGNPDEPPYLVIRDGWIIPDGPGKRSIQVAEASVRELPSEYLPYVSVLPGFVVNYAQP